MISQCPFSISDCSQTDVYAYRISTICLRLCAQQIIVYKKSHCSFIPYSTLNVLKLSQIITLRVMYVRLKEAISEEDYMYSTSAQL